MHNNYLEKLKNCTTEHELRELFNDKKFPHLGESKFSDKHISLIGSGNMFTNFEIKINGVAELALRVVFYLKLDGYINNVPQNSGQISYFNAFHSIMKELLQEAGDIKSLQDLSSENIDFYIKNTHGKAGTIHRKIQILNEWIEFGNDYLPYFLQLDEGLLVYSKEYKNLKQVKKIEDEQYLLKIDTKEPYPLPNIKYLVSYAIDYIEKYNAEILDVAKHFMETKGLHQGKMYTGDFDYFKNRKEVFQEPRLQIVQDKVKNTKQKYLNEHRINLGRSITGNTIRAGMYNAIREMETSCIILILMITGMRVGELCTLDRSLSIRKDEHFNLTRIVYKTASTPEGEKLEMPIPDIARKALCILSELATIKDGKKEGNIITSPINRENVEPVRPSRVNSLINEYCELLEVDTPPTPHQFRHAMAFLIVHINEKDGLELARMFLGHKSITMTLQYMGHYNNELKEAVAELKQEESKQLVEAITDEIANNRKIFGTKGERLMPTHKFMGKQAEDFIVLMKKGLLQLINEKKLAILQTPVCLCMHNTEEVDSMVCQRGFNIKEIVERGPAPSRCSGANCANAIFFEKHIQGLSVYDDIEPDLKARLEENTYFMDAGGFNNDPFGHIIKEYKEHKKG